MAKKVPISITLDGEVLRDLDGALREVQAQELKQRKTLSTRSSLIEQYIRAGILGGGSGS